MHTQRATHEQLIENINDVIYGIDSGLDTSRDENYLKEWAENNGLLIRMVYDIVDDWEVAGELAAIIWEEDRAIPDGNKDRDFMVSNWRMIHSADIKFIQMREIEGMIMHDPETLNPDCVAFACSIAGPFIESAIKKGIYGEFVEGAMNESRIYDYVNAPGNSYGEHFHDCNGSDNELWHNGAIWHLFEN